MRQVIPSLTHEEFMTMEPRRYYAWYTWMGIEAKNIQKKVDEIKNKNKKGK